MSRIAIGIEYDGSGYLGWQRLAHGETVEAKLTAAVGFVANHPVRLIAAGRTDAGVHAEMQVAHFDSDAERSPRGWTLGANSRLPDDIAVVWAMPMSDEFHARYSALARRYVYRVLNRSVRPALDARRLAWEHHALDADAMHVAGQALIGEHDFSAFRAAQCQSLSPMRRLDRIGVRRDGAQIAIEVEGNAFLHHMVRNIAGALLAVGRGERPVQWIAEVLATRDRRRAAPTASASGLTFLGPRYPRAFALPSQVTAEADTPPRPLSRRALDTEERSP